MALWQWSRTPANNATADPTINWSEGIPPSLVDDNLRAMMTRVAEWRDDTSGSLTTGGSSTAYTLTTAEGFQTPTPVTGQQICFVVNVTNGANSTLAIDTGGAYPIQSAPGVAVASGVMVAGSPYRATFSGSAWLLQDFYASAFVVPIGSIMPYVGASAPNSNFVFPSGQAISRTIYATLFGLCGTTFGAGDGVTTFNIPDCRNRSIYMQDNNIPGSNSLRISVAGLNYDGTVIGNTGGNQFHLLTLNETPAHTHPNTLNDPTHRHTLPYQTLGGMQASGGGQIGPQQNSGSDVSLFASTGVTISNASQGGGQSHTILGPSIILPMILRIL